MPHSGIVVLVNENDPAKRTRACANCGKTTTNNKFCSLSCSAVHTGSEHPKRKPEGTCEVCEAAIPTRKRLCETCVVEVEERSRRVKQGFRSIRTLDGGTAEIRVVDVRTESAIVFANSVGLDDNRLKPSSRCGDLIQILSGVLLRQPEYLGEEDVERHLAFLEHLRSFVVAPYGSTAHEKGRSAEGFPLSDLETVGSAWFNFWRRIDNHPLMSTLAIGTLEVVDAHLFGYEFVRDRSLRQARILPLAHSSLFDEGSAFPFLRDSRFKKELTESISRWYVAKVPAGARIVERRSAQTFIGEGEYFLFRAQRGHLTTGVPDRLDLKVEDDRALELDLHANFCFYGAILDTVPPAIFDQNANTSELLNPIWRKMSDRMPQLSLPIRWIVASVSDMVHSNRVDVVPALVSA
jgi:hypothetical protein